MVTRGGTNDFNGRAYTYFRDDTFNARGAFLPDGAPKPDGADAAERASALGGPIVRNRAHFYFTFENDHEEIAGQKRFPPRRRRWPPTCVGAFEVGATNYFARGDLQLNAEATSSTCAGVLETAPTRGEGFNTNNADPRRADVGERLGSPDQRHLHQRAQRPRVQRDPRRPHRRGAGHRRADATSTTTSTSSASPAAIRSRSGSRTTTRATSPARAARWCATVIRTYVFDESFSYFVPQPVGRRAHLQGRRRRSASTRCRRARPSISGTFKFRSDAPYNPANPATYPFQFDITLGPPGVERLRRRTPRTAATTSSSRTSGGVEQQPHAEPRPALRQPAPDARPATTTSRRALGFAWDVIGSGNTVVRGGVGKFYAYLPVVLDLTHQQSNVRDAVPDHLDQRPPATPRLHPAPGHDHRLGRATPAWRS